MSQAAPSIEAAPIPVALATALGHVRDELGAAAGENLVALVLYGGLARGRYRGPKSDIDLAVVLEDASTERVRLLTPVLLAAWRAARVEPWIVCPSGAWPAGRGLSDQGSRHQRASPDAGR